MRNRVKYQYVTSLLLLIPIVLCLGCQATTLNIADVGTSANPLEKWGELVKDEVWAGKVLVSGDVLVPEGVTLTIQSGTVVGLSPPIHPTS